MAFAATADVKMIVVKDAASAGGRILAFPGIVSSGIRG
jgi:hypothetical protein